MSKKHGRENDTVSVEAEVEKSDVAKREETIQAFWEEHNIFNTSVETPAGGEPKGEYVFYDGPPFATGLPHYGHLLAGTIKDAIPRFWTMQGYRVRRQWGWDCHGLPLENLIEKELGLATKRDIEDFGVQNFNEKARGAVLRYADEWRKIVPRFGRFVDMEHDYKTMDSSYTESVWWVFKTLHEKGLVYEGFKSMHLCPRCGTTLSNFEVNQGYKDIKDIAVTVKLPLLDEAGATTDTSLLVWTTTPWTLPGNLAAAVHNDYEYVEVSVTTENGNENVILAKGRLAQLGDMPYQIINTMTGADLVGRRYEPPFPYLKDQDMEGKDKAWTIYHADYVELGEEGTGAVHLAPAYGEEDMDLAKAHGVPIFHHVAEDGRFKDCVTDLAGQLVKPKDDDEAGVLHIDADIAIVKALKANEKLFKKENITHSYPHCWRCDTPLLNYATTSWFVEVTKFRDQLVAENQKVHWVPEHIGVNRFGKWLEGARDWAVSRQRYWGAPLPIWKNPTTGEYRVLGSLADIQAKVPKSGNQYLLMRHGESESNVAGIVSAKSDNQDGLTKTGQEQIEAAISTLPNQIDLIIHSGFQRTRETAEQIAAHYPEATLLEDGRIRELDIGVVYDGQTWADYEAEFPTFTDRYTKRPEGGIENRRDIQVRTGEFLFELEQTHRHKTILIVGHGASLFGLESAARGFTPEDAFQHKTAVNNLYLENAEVRELPFTLYPHNDHYELDFHRPYIDQIDLYEGDTKLERVPDVFDCWFESGSMPYGQHHYPFRCDEATFQEKHFPAQFIAESVDQTRGWFYSMMVLGVALFGKSPFENAITNGLVLAEDGKKMSKSLQNYPDPVELANRVGVDAIRYYLLSAPIMHGEDLNFSEKEVLELQRKNIGRLHNVLAMYEMFADGTEARADSEQVLDRWIITRLNQLIAEVTAGYKNYELQKANRPIADLIDDISVWYLRRSRDRLKGEDAEDKKAALATLRHVLRELAKVMAPAMPFYAEHLYRGVRTEAEPASVHLTAWPEGGAIDTELIDQMAITRELVTQALEARTKAGIKVRQPLASVTIPDSLEAAYHTIIAEEVNVKAVHSGATVVLDTTLTPELVAEGAVRELMRAVQGTRKEMQLQPDDAITLTISTDVAGHAALEQHLATLKRTVGAEEVSFQDTEGDTVTAGEYTFVYSIEKR